MSGRETIMKAKKRRKGGLAKKMVGNLKKDEREGRREGGVVGKRGLSEGKTVQSGVGG